MRIADVAEAIEFYGGLGFSEYYSGPDPDDKPVFAMLQRGDALLCWMRWWVCRFRTVHESG